MEKLVGLLCIIFGLFLVIFPVFSSAVLSMVIGFTLVCFGMSAMCMGFVFTENRSYAFSSFAIGLISLIFGICFMFFLNALPFLVSLQFYIIGFLMIVYGLLGVIYLDDKKYAILSAISILLGILTVALAVIAASQPVLTAVIIGVFVIVDGVFVLVMGKSEELIQKNE